MSPRVTILGAGFAGMELATQLSDTFGDTIEVTLIDQGEAFTFGYSKLDVMFGKAELGAVRLPYARFAKPGVRFVRDTVTAIDPTTKRVTRSGGTHDADYLVIALGADYDPSATPGVVLGQNEFYSVAGAAALREPLARLTSGRVVIGVCAAPYKCPPAPSECALMLHDALTTRGVRGACEITIVSPLPSPVPPSPETSKALLEAFAERGIRFVASRKIARVDADRSVVALDDGAEIGCDLFLGVPKHRAPAVIEAAGMAVDGWIPVDPRSLATKFADVWAIGDIAATGVPKAGVFAEGAAGAVAKTITAKIRGGGDAGQNPGAGTCYLEFGGGRIGKVEVDFLSGPKATGRYHEPSEALRTDKIAFGAHRRARWFGMS
jgi:sulfide:quinone oxidoreductase